MDSGSAEIKGQIVHELCRKILAPLRAYRFQQLSLTSNLDGLLNFADLHPNVQLLPGGNADFDAVTQRLFEAHLFGGDPIDAGRQCSENI